MDGADVGGSFRVHLQSLKDFAQRLQEQMEVVQRSTRAAAVLNRPPDLPLGTFAEAFSLSDDHADAVGRSATLLDKVARSIDFARSVTALVAQRYDTLNSAGAQSIAAVGGAMPAMGVPLMPTVQAMPAMPAAPPAPAPVPASPVTGTAAPPAGSLATPDVVARVVVPIPPAGGTVYYYDGSSAVPVSIAVRAQDA